MSPGTLSSTARAIISRARSVLGRLQHPPASSNLVFGASEPSVPCDPFGLAGRKVDRNQNVCSFGRLQAISGHRSLPTHSSNRWENRGVNAPHTNWAEVWRLYAENQDVFAAVFADLGSEGIGVAREGAVDYVHEFLVERAPAALETFRPERGELKAWLFVVFKRFVLGTLRERATQERLLRKFAADASPSQPEQEQQLDIVAVQAAVAALPAKQQRAVRAFLQAPGGSIRDVARTLGVSRWRASQLVSDALEALSSHLGLPEDAAPKGLRELVSVEDEDRP
jgi:RNA polymerase sigma factor (sigma-70 family)